MAVFAAFFTFPLLFVGGSVTTYRVGLAVPDWPTTFGINMFLYDFWNAPFGVQIEHTHRLYGAAVGLATIALCVWFLVFEPRRWMKWLGVVALLAVIAQGVLGGTRVTQVSTFLAAVHGCTAMAYFGLMVALCVLTGRAWYSNQPPMRDRHHLRPLSLLLLGVVCVQIGLGAWLRHYASRLRLDLAREHGTVRGALCTLPGFSRALRRPRRHAACAVGPALGLRSAGPIGPWGPGACGAFALGWLAAPGAVLRRRLPHRSPELCSACTGLIRRARSAGRPAVPSGAQLARHGAETATDSDHSVAADSAPRSMSENLEVVA